MLGHPRVRKVILAAVLTLAATQAQAGDWLADRGWYAPAGRGLVGGKTDWPDLNAGSGARGDDWRFRPADPYVRLYGHPRAPAPVLPVTGAAIPPVAFFPSLGSVLRPDLGAAEPVLPYCRPADTPGGLRYCLTATGDWEQRR